MVLCSKRAAGAAFAVVSVAFAGCQPGPTPAPQPAPEKTAKASEALQNASLVGSSLPAKTLALTFDDGPGDSYKTFSSTAGEISRYLKTQNIRATFFVNGARINTTTLNNSNNIALTTNATTVLAQIIADGHLIGNHTVTHRDMVTEVLPLGTGAAQLLQELSETDTDISGYVPSGHYLFRAPYGSWSNGVAADLTGGAMNKYVGPVYWDAGGISTAYPGYAADWACWQGSIYTAASGGATKVDLNGAANKGYLTTSQCCDAYLAEIHALTTGGVVLMHDPYFWAQGSTVDMVETCLVPTLQAEGYSFVRADEVPDIVAKLPACDASCKTCLGTGPTYCSSCADGVSYLTGSTCTACSTCGAGTYASAACTGTANTVCSACDASCATCTGPGTDACTSCHATSYLDSNVCHACSSCAPGSYASTACTSTSAPTCSACSPGTYSNASTVDGCTQCAPGTATATSGSTACTPCAAGTSAPTAGLTACTACAPGQFAAAGAASCSPCKAGTFAATAGAACTACPDGTSSADGATACTACAPGTSSKSGAACAPCAAGTYAASAGAATCIACAPGTSADAPGATACTSGPGGGSSGDTETDAGAGGSTNDSSSGCNAAGNRTSLPGTSAILAGAIAAWFVRRRRRSA